MNNRGEIEVMQQHTRNKRSILNKWFCRHDYEPLDIPYHIRCKKCGKVEYVGY